MSEMTEVARIIKSIDTASGSTKLLILQRHSDNELLKSVLKFIYNPYNKTGISATKMDKALSTFKCPADLMPIDCREAMGYFAYNTTGNSVDLIKACLFITSQETHMAQWLAKQIITQGLKIGITATSLNKVYGSSFIPKIGCMLGTLYFDVNPGSIAWPCIVTEKLDGVRRMLVKDNGKVTIYSRSGHVDTGLVDIVRDAALLPDNFTYDGELLAIGEFDDSIAQRQATSSLAACKGEKHGLCLNVFDMIPTAEFYANNVRADAQERKTRLAATFNDDSLYCLEPDKWPALCTVYGMPVMPMHIKAVPILGVVDNVDEALDIVEPLWERGREGIMLNTIKGHYEIKRSKSLLKIKHTEEYVLPIVDFIEGTGKYAGMLGAVVVNYKDSGVGIGSGFTDAQRQSIWDNREKYIGRKVELETFGESTNAQGGISLNCPIFKRFVGEQE